LADVKGETQIGLEVCTQYSLIRQ